ncbi:MAG: hypothetical protein J2P25_07095, partial [Nocardiopsaceae bacterium]|nr:hypothetical protein [Nocardiopsaceae bacterium]
ASVRPGGGRAALRVAGRDASRFEGTITARDDGTFTVLRDGKAEPWPCPASQAPELRALLLLRDTVCSLLDAEKASAEDTPQVAELRARLNREYDACVAAHGPLNRVSWRRTGRTDEAGNPKWARQAPAQGGFRQDPYAAAVYALEDFDPETGAASKAPIFTRRVIADRQPAESAETAADAIAICMDADGQVRLERAASLLGAPSPDDARAALGDLVYDEPGTGRLVPAAEYLSGKVRDKLAEAEKAAQADPRFAVNVAALRAALPADLGPGEIDARLGASWIPPEYVQQGLREILQDPALTAVKGYGTSWQVKGSTRSVEARDVYGTADKDAVALAQCLLEQRPVKVSYSMDDLTPAEREQLSAARSREDMAAWMRARSGAATVAARAKADELSDRFAEWLWEDPQRTAELARIYNEKFNSLVLRSYDDARPRLPGLAEWFKPFDHQYAAVARIVSEPAALLAHEVGAGKTAEMAMGCMELRRLGLASKPAIVVPNHMLEQFQREFLQLYPQAAVLAAGKSDLEKNRRHAFIARIATGDWDAVIMSRSVFERIPMSAAEQERYINAKLAAYDAWLEKAASESDDTRMVKRMEKQRLSFEERLKRKLTHALDAGISWEQTGIDYLFIDEAHGYKNRDTRSNSPSLDIDGSGRAADLEAKLDYLRRENGQRIVTFATATPIANSMTEAYVMLSYLRPDLLTDAGIEDFDGWAGSFASTVADVEVAPEGGLRVKERVARFRNLPELLLMWRVVADVKTAEDLNLPVPDLADGKAEVVTIPPSDELHRFMLTLSDRADDVRTGRVEPKEDNMLKISSDGRAAALDMRLVGQAPAEDGKLDIAAGRIAEIYRDTRDNAYTDRDGNEEPARGSLQIVFCELGTPTGNAKFGVYEYLKAKLADHGVPAAQVRFMHEARNDKEKADLFAAARSGKVSVLIGTTELMGVGTNVQKRAVALHHLDCPWRPADVAQREGRILRQGNQNPAVAIIRYVTEGSFDAYMWQTVLRKAKFIAQVMHGSLDSREMEDIGGSDALSYSEVTALATGDMRILAKAKADAEVQRLSKLETSWKRTKRHLKTRIADGQRDLPRLRDKAAKLDAAIARRTPMKGDAFHCELGGKPIRKRADAADELQSALEAVYRASRLRDRDHDDEPGGTPLGTFGGFSLEARAGMDNFGVYANLRFPAIPGASIRIRPADPKAGIITKLENKLAALDEALSETRQQVTGTEAEIERARASLDAPFAKAAELARARYESDRLAAELGGQQPPPQEPEAHETPVTDAGAEADPGEDDIASEAQNETWTGGGDTEADPDEDLLEDTAPVNDIDDDEWDTEATEPAEAPAEAETAETAETDPGTADAARGPASEEPGSAPATSVTPATASAPAPERAPSGEPASAAGPHDDASAGGATAPPPASPAEAAPEPGLPPAGTQPVESHDDTPSRDATPAETTPEPELPPAGTQPVASHRSWGGTLRPERLLYADGTPLTVLEETEDGDEARPATAAGCKPLSEHDDYGSGCLQVVRWDGGGYGTTHPARITPRGTDPYEGLSERQRARWELFDRYESYGNPVAYIPARLINPGDVLQVERGPRSRVMDMREVQSASVDTTGLTPILRISVRGVKNALQYPPDQMVGVHIHQDHPTLAATIEAITGSRPAQPPEPARDDAPGRDDSSAPDATPAEPVVPQPAPQEPFSPQEPVSSPEPATPPPAPAIRIEHDHQGTRVYGTSKSQTAVRNALKAEGFKWSRQGYWYLNRSWYEHTRATRVRGLTTALATLGIDYEVTRPGATPAAPANPAVHPISTEPETTPPAPPEPATRQETQAEPAAAPASSEPQATHSAAANPAVPAQSETHAEATAATTEPDAPTEAEAHAEPDAHADTGSTPPAPAEPQPAAPAPVGDLHVAGDVAPAPAPAPAPGFEQESLFGSPNPAEESTSTPDQDDHTEPTPNPGTQRQVAEHDQQQQIEQAAPGTPTATAEATAEPPIEQADSASAADADNADEKHDVAPQDQGAPPSVSSPAQATAISNLGDIPVNPTPLAGRSHAESGTRSIESDYQGWISTRNHQDDSRLPKEHPRVRQLITRWRAVHAKGIADGPGPSAARYHALAHAALSLATATSSTDHPRELAALNQLATDARKFSARLRATAEHAFATGEKAARYRGDQSGRDQAERGSRIVEQDYRTWSRTAAPAEAARDLTLWEQARRAELAWHAIRRSGLHDGPGPSAARYKELADATQALADAYSPSLPSAALLPLLQLTDHARKHSIRLDATERARTRQSTARASEHNHHNGRPPGGDPYTTLPSELSAVTRNAHAAQHRPPAQHSTPTAADPPPSRNPALARHGARPERD